MGLINNLEFTAEEWIVYLARTNRLLDELWTSSGTKPREIQTYLEAQNYFIDLVSEKYVSLTVPGSDYQIHRQFDEMFHCFRIELSHEMRKGAIYAVNRFYFIAITQAYACITFPNAETDGFLYLIYRFGPLIYYLNQQEIELTVLKNPQLRKTAAYAFKRSFYLKKYRHVFERPKKVLSRLGLCTTASAKFKRMRSHN